MLTVHHLNRSQSERIVWLCEELGIPYDLKVYPRDAQGAAPAAYKALHPQGTAPTITDGAVTLAESGAIVDYILAKYGKGKLAVGPDAPNFADYLYWLHFGNGFFVPSAMMALVGSAMAGGNAEAAKRFGGRLDLAYKLAEARLGKVPYLAGQELTAADIMTVYPLTTLRMTLVRSLADYPNIRAYLQRIGARPAYQRAMEKGDAGMKPNLE